MISSSITINAPPAVVREIFLDFPNLSAWHQGIILSCRPLDDSKTGMTLKQGDKTETRLSSMTVVQDIIENTPEVLTTNGPWMGLLTGLKSCLFTSDPSNPNITHFEQRETFTGILSFMMNNPDRFGGYRTKEAFAKINEDLKIKAEQVWQERSV